MGLGKSVQVLARVVEGEATAAQKKAGYHGTLVVAPVAVMEQWVGEVKSKTRGLKVTTHHGPSRAKLGAKLAKYDIIVTTFQTLASEHGKFVKFKTDTQKKLDEMDSSEEEERTKAKKILAKDAHPLFERKWLRVVIGEYMRDSLPILCLSILTPTKMRLKTSRITTPKRRRHHAISRPNTDGVCPEHQSKTRSKNSTRCFDSSV